MTYAVATVAVMPNPHDNIIKRIEASIFNLYDKEIKLTPETKIRELEIWGSSTYEFDSLDKLEWTMELEDHFDIDILAKDITLPETIGELADFISSMVGAQTE